MHPYLSSRMAQERQRDLLALARRSRRGGRGPILAAMGLVLVRIGGRLVRIGGRLAGLEVLRRPDMNMLLIGGPGGPDGARVRPGERRPR
jgi:hypothetical protein